MGPKIENVGFSLVLPLLFEGSRAVGGRQENEQNSEKCRLGGGRGGQTLPLVGLFEVLGGLEGLETGSKPLHAQRHKASADL